MNCTRPRMFELLLLERPRKPAAVEEAIMKTTRGSDQSTGYSG
jgi:hypothetical protein